MKTKFQPLGEVPILRGNEGPNFRYCGKRCGAGCTFQEYENAKNMGEILVSTLIDKTGKEFYLRLWENLGWHYEAVFEPQENSKISISPTRSGDYSADCDIQGRQYYHLYGTQPLDCFVVAKQRIFVSQQKEGEAYEKIFN